MSSREIRIKVLPLTQPVGNFYVGVISGRDLFQIAHADVRRMDKEKREVESYMGVQRPMSKSRVKRIKEYVKTIDASFPTSVILAVDAECAKLVNDQTELVLREYEGNEALGQKPIPFDKIAKILDGQHRVAGFEDAAEDFNFDLIVSIFIDMDIADQGQLFSVVNLSQTKVTKSLAYDLAGLVSAPTPQKICHLVAVELNSYENSPFYRRVKRLGVASEGGEFSEILTQSTVVEAIMAYVTDDPMRDRDIVLRGKKPGLLPHKNLPLRSLWIEGDYLQIAKIVWAYFDSVKTRWPSAWDIGSGFMLPRTNGFKAFMRFFGVVYPHLIAQGGKAMGDLIPKGEYVAVWQQVNLEDEQFNTQEFSPGAKGEADLFKRLKEDTGLGGKK